MSSSRLRPMVALLALAAALWLAFQRGSTPDASSNAVAKSSVTPSGAAGSPDASADPAICAPADAAPARTFASAVAARAQRETALAQAAAFTDWLTEWRRADSAGQAVLATTGRQLAATRRSALKHLIETDPRRALELAIPVGLREELPPDVREQLERHVDRRGELEVSILHQGAEARRERVAVIDGVRYRAHVFGRRESQQTKVGLPLHGITIDDVMALEETPYRLLDDAEKAARQIAREQIAVLVGEQVSLAATPRELAEISERLVSAESGIGPIVVADSADGAANPTIGTPPTAAVTSPPSWINGTKRVLWLKIDFSDDPGAAYTDAEITATSATVTDFYTANSQGKTTMTFTILPSVLRMPRDKAYYNSSSTTNGELYTAARDAAKAYDVANGNAGTHDPDRYDRYIILHKRVPAYTYGGVATLGGARTGLNNTVSPGTTGHELGHNQSLDHSHYWLPAGTSAVGAGAHVEYGDVFDIMGSSGSSPNNHFNVAQKAKLGYLDEASITTVTQAGTYRIARHDHRDAAGLRALKIAPADLGYEYWVEHRRFGPTAFNNAQLDRLRNGVLMHWGPTKSPKFTTGAGSYLVDATAGSAGGANDAPLRIGETFTDPDAGVTIKPLTVGGTAPNEYIDVQVLFGAIDGNRNPTLQAAAPAGTLAARTNVIFNASASDPDGDSLYFRWDFGDGQLQPNLSNITRRFTKGGKYTLRVSAHDGKGGIAARTFELDVADPLVTWTQRNPHGGNTQALYDVVYGSGRFLAVGINQTILGSSDGQTWTRVPFPTSGHNFTGIAHNGSRFVISGYRFSNTTQKGLAAYSDDGTTWTQVNLNTGLAQFWGIAHGAGRFVMAGDSGIIYSSTDGATWTAAASTGITTTLRAVSFADGLFVISGDNGRVLTSPDGVNWTNRSLATTAGFWGPVRHNGLWLVRSATTMYTSPDGATWTRVVGSNAVASVYKGVSLNGVLLYGTGNGSVDFGESSQTWASVQLDTTANVIMRSATVAQGMVVAVGSGSLIYTAAAPTASTSAPLIAAPVLRNEADSLKVSVGRKNVLSASGAGFTKLELYANGSKVSEVNGSAGALTWTPAAIGNYSLVVRGINAAGESVVSSAVPAIAGFANWNTRNPAPSATDLRGAVRVGNKWWVVGGAGTLISFDGTTLTPIDFPTSQQLNSIAYGNGRFVVGTFFTDSGSKEEIGSIWTSTDGYAWTPLLTSILESAFVYNVTFGGERFVAVGSGGLVMTSTDGLVWTRQVSNTTSLLRSVTYENGQYVAVGGGGRIITSPDATTWTVRTSNITTDLYSVTAKAGTFVAVGLSGVILSSTNGTAWTRPTSGVTGNLLGAGVVKGSFVVTGTGGVTLASGDGATWSSAAMDGKFSNGLAVVGSGDDGLLLGSPGEIYVANSATSWRRISQGTTESKFAVIYAGGRFVTVGQTTDQVTRVAGVPISYSTDGITWTRATQTTGFTNVNDIGFAGGTYVTVGDTGRIFSSTNANTWTQRTSGVTTQLNAIAGSPAGFVAAGAAGTILSSTDAITWSPRTSGATQPLRAATFGNGKYVVVGDNGAVLHSSDGTTWSTATSGVTAALLTVGWWENFGFIAAGNTGTMIGSIDGVTWQQIETGVSDAIAAIAHTPIGLVASAGINGTMLVSLDGANWSISTLPADRMIRGLAASSNAIVAVGDQGAMLTFEVVDTSPPPVISAQPLSQSTTLGTSVTLSVDAQNASGAVYQWMKDGVPIIGANSPVYTIPVVTAAGIGTYTVAITTATGTVTSGNALVSLGAIADPGRLINLSILTSLSSATDDFTFGVVVGGAGTSGGKAVLVRAAGPSLAALGVGGVLEDPKLEFFTGSIKVGENDNWGGTTAITTAMAEVGAFAFSGPNSRDAAISLPSLAIGQNSAKISGTGAGTVIAELYDATPSHAFTTTTPRLVNVSVLKHLGTGVTAGFVIGGSTTRTVLVRAIGPTLGSFGLGGVVADPQLSLFRGSTQIGANDNWGGSAALSAAFAQVGAFALANDSRDAAIRITLTPGNYTAQVSGVGGVTGTALIEIYEVPE